MIPASACRLLADPRCHRCSGTGRVYVHAAGRNREREKPCPCVGRERREARR